LRQVEQDLIISRALCDLFNAPALKGSIAFRGGTAIHKLLFDRPLRYSEDIDLVQTRAEPIGATVDAIRDALSWLGKCSRAQAGHSMHLVFKFAPEIAPQTTLKLKVEVNTREHASLHGLKSYPFAVHNDWHQATAEIASFQAQFLKEVLSMQGPIDICLDEEAGHFSYMDELPPKITDSHPNRSKFLASLANDVGQFVIA
jgi:predicted nucleotidyltransferase component of viral defense system